MKVILEVIKLKSLNQWINKIAVIVLTVGFLLLSRSPVFAASISWTGGSSGSWNTASNWSTSTIPTSSDDVIIDNASVTASGSNISFNTLTVGLGTNITSLTLTSNFGTAGSVNVNNAGTIIQNNKIQQVISGTLTINSGGKLTDTANTSTNSFNVNISAGNITLNSGGSINANGDGYTGSNSQSSGNGPGGGGSASYCISGGGAGHGGLGGTSSQNGTGGITYDSTTNPTDLGSGGGGYCNTGGNGGGAIILTTLGTLSNNGIITANGSVGNNWGGGGSGGTVNITANVLSGTGSIESNGANGANNNGAGAGGGRIAIKYNTNNASFSTLSTYGGTGYMYSPNGGAPGQNYGYGGAGTIYEASQSQTNRTLIIDNNNNVSYNNGAELSDYTIPLDSIILQHDGILHITSGSTMTISANEINNNGGDNTGILSNDGTLVLPSNYTLNNFILWANSTGSVSGLTNLTIGQYGILSHAYNTTSRNYFIDLNLTSLTINSGGSVSANFNGYSGSNTSSSGNGPGGGGSSSGCIYGGGGGHGGVGGTSSQQAPEGVTYDSVSNPIDLGSGAGGYCNNGGAGGGAVILNISGTLTNNGTISANGAPGAMNQGGGGSGGSINLTVGTLAGTGLITVNGGNALGGGGGGGGGRIAIKYNFDTSTFSSITAFGGTGYTSNGANYGYGAAGTIYKATQSGTSRTLIIDSNNINTQQNYTQIDQNITLDDLQLKNDGQLEVVNSVTLTLPNNYININGDSSGDLINNGTLNFSGSSYTLNGYTLIENYHPGIQFANLNTIIIGSTGILTSLTNSVSPQNYIDLTISNLTVDSGGQINVNGDGYTGGSTSGNGPGGGTGDSCGNTSSTAASHGGVGGVDPNSTRQPSKTYDSVINPVDPGSGGGGTYCGSGGNGGGVVILNISGTLVNNGTISADAGITRNYGEASGGSGGSVNITVGSLSGLGTISAGGGSNGSQYRGSSGGGGRIAIKYNTNSFPISSIKAYGGSVGNYTGNYNVGYGGAGTIYMTTQSGNNKTLIVDNNNINSANNGAEMDNTGISLDSIILQNDGILHIQHGQTMNISNNEINNGSGNISGVLSNDGSLSLPLSSGSYTLNNYTLWEEPDGSLPGLANLTIGTNGILSHGFNGISKVNYLSLILNSLTINSGGSINTDTKGYQGGAYGSGPGGGGGDNCGGGGSGGGSHGGLGANFSSYSPSKAYDSLTNPTDLGSGSGGSNCGDGVNGGGAILLSISGTIVNNGTISANGGSAVNYGGGSGGAGGTINITATDITGSGVIEANGGNANGYAGGGGGGGGRIRIGVSSDGFSGNINSLAGQGINGGGPGSSGSIYYGIPNFTDIAITGNNSTNSTINNIQTLSFWAKPATSTASFIQLASGVDVYASSGIVETDGIVSPTIYVNGSLGNSINAGVWNMITITTPNFITANSVELGQMQTGDLNGGLDDVRFYTSDYQASDVSALYSSSNLAASLTDALTNSEQQGPNPMAYWKFDDAQGTLAQDSSTNHYNGTLSGSSLPTWQTADQCVSNGCLFFNGISSYVTAPSMNNIETIDFWAKSATSTASLVQLAPGVDIYANNGTISTDGITAPTVYVNGNQSTSLSPDTWEHITITTPNPISASNITLGKTVYGVLSGYMDEVKLFDYITTLPQIHANNNAKGTANGASAELGTGINNNTALSNGLVGYWKMDEATWSGTLNEVVDSSGNGNNGTAKGFGGDYPYPVVGKFGNAGYFDGLNSGAEYVSVPSFPSTPTTTFAAWVKPYVVGGRQAILRFTSSNDNEGLYIWNGKAAGYFGATTTSGITTLVAGNWYFLTMTYDGNTQKVYLNGNLEASAVVGSYSDVGGNLNIGSTGDAYNGLVDEARIYNRALSAQDVQNLYNYTPGPVAYYNFEEGPGSTTVLDKSGNGNNGTWQGTLGNQYKTGKYGWAGNFNGTNNYVSITSPIFPSTLSDFSIGGWFKQSSKDSLNGALVSIGNSVSLHSKSDQIVFTVDYTTDFITSTFIPDGKWHYLEGVYDGTKIYLYLDGNLVNSGTTLPPTSLTNLYIGSSSGWGIWQDGLIDDVRIYNYAISQKQIIQDMNGGASTVSTSVNHTGALGYWKFNEGTGNVADNSGYGGSLLNGTISNATWTDNGRENKALVFNGTSSQVAVSNMPTMSQATVCAWINTSANAPAQYIYSQVNAGNSANLDMIITSSGVGKVNLWNGSEAAAISTMVVNDGKWHHMCGTYDGSYVKLYIDGQIQASTSTYALTIGNLATIGANYFPSYYNFDGIIDDVKVYPYALTASEIQMDYNHNSGTSLTSLGNNPNYAPGSQNQIYCVPGDTSTCAPPVGEWNFAEGPGSTTVYDTSGNGNNGTWNGTGKQHYVHANDGTLLNGWAGNFDGSNDIVNIADTSTLKPAGNFTISSWFKTTNADAVNNSAGAAFLFYSGSQNPTPLGIGLGIYQGKMYAFSGNTGSYYTLSSTGNVNDGHWHYAVFTYDGSRMYLYIDGILNNSNAATINPTYSATNYINIGGYTTNGSAYYYYGGQIEGLKVYNYARTPAQVVWDYNKGGPVGWWKFDECQGATAYDSSGNGNNGTINFGSLTPGTCTDGTNSSFWSKGSIGKFNNSFYGDGSDDYIDVPYSMANVPSSSQSYSVWIKTGYSGQQGILTFSNCSSSSGCGSWDRTLRINSNGTVNFYMSIANGSAQENLSSIGVINDNNWHNIIAVDTGSSYIIYIDGKLDSSASDTYTGFTGYSSPYLDIGQATTYGYFNGLIDDARIYNYALTPYQVQLLYNGGSALRFGPTSGMP